MIRAENYHSQSVGSFHATHFLQRLHHRASDRATALAMKLYYQTQVVRFLMAMAPIPTNAKRVAISLDESDRGAYAVVDTKTGWFVTCLGSGMYCDLYRITYGQLLAYLKKYEKVTDDVRSVNEILDKDGGRSVKKLFRRLRVAGDGISVEEMETLQMFQTLLRHRFLKTLLKEIALFQRRNRSLLAYRALHPVRHRDILKRHYDSQWLISHLLVLISSEGNQELAYLFDTDARSGLIEYLSLGCCNGMIGPLIRTVYAIGQFGKPVLASCKQAATSPKSVAHWILGVLGLGIIALRHRKYRTEIKKTFKQFEKGTDSLNPLTQRLWGAVGKEEAVRILIAAIERPDETGDRFSEYCKAVYSHHQAELPECYRYETKEANPDSLSQKTLCNLDSSLYEAPIFLLILFQMLPWLAQAEPRDIYLNKQSLGIITGPWKPESTLQMVKVERRTKGLIPMPVKAEKRPLRNSPCPCGSGKKYKKCCRLV